MPYIIHYIIQCSAATIAAACHELIHSHVLISLPTIHQKAMLLLLSEMPLPTGSHGKPFPLCAVLTVHSSILKHYQDGLIMINNANRHVKVQLKKVRFVWSNFIPTSESADFVDSLKMKRLIFALLNAGVTSPLDLSKHIERKWDERKNRSKSGQGLNTKVISFLGIGEFFQSPNYVDMQQFLKPLRVEFDNFELWWLLVAVGKNTLKVGTHRQYLMGLNTLYCAHYVWTPALSPNNFGSYWVILHKTQC